MKDFLLHSIWTFYFSIRCPFCVCLWYTSAVLGCVWIGKACLAVYSAALLLTLVKVFYNLRTILNINLWCSSLSRTSFSWWLKIHAQLIQVEQVTISSHFCMVTKAGVVSVLCLNQKLCAIHHARALKQANMETIHHGLY